MQTNEEVLKLISNETLGALNSIQIVTPSIYASVFEKYASSHGADLSDEEKLTDRLLDEKIQMCNLFQEKTTKNAIALSDSTSKAIIAIKEKDEVLLQKVLEETNNLKREIEKLKEAVYKDELTNVYNRKWMHDKFLENGSENFKKDGTLAMIDLNYFKIINDTYGHIVGDKVLVFIANQLKTIKEKVVRYGGDEFIVLFSDNTTKEIAFEKLNSIREKVIHKKLKSSESAFRVSFSIGIHSFKKGDFMNAVIEQADTYMYADKQKIKQKITGID